MCCCTCAGSGAHELPCDAALTKGQEMGWFEHGSTIIVFAPCGFTLDEGVRPGQRLRAGQPLMRLPPATAVTPA
jgi:phosphatidylserine decarboxylase